MNGTTPSVDQINAMLALAGRAKQHRADNPQPDWVVRRDTFLNMVGLDPSNAEHVKLIDSTKFGVEPTVIRLAYEQYRRENPVASDSQRKGSASPAYAQIVQAQIEQSFAD